LAQHLTWQWFSELGRQHELTKLTELFALGLPPQNLAEGFTEGGVPSLAIFAPLNVLVNHVLYSWLPVRAVWQGKSLNASALTGQNDFQSWLWPVFRLVWPRTRFRRGPRGIVGFDFTTRIEPGAIEPAPEVLVIDYSNPLLGNPFPISRIRDEVVEIVPGTYLGRALFRLPRNRCPNICYFSFRQPVSA
jgi:hypothetical protein